MATDTMRAKIFAAQLGRLCNYCTVFNLKSLVLIINKVDMIINFRIQIGFDWGIRLWIFGGFFAVLAKSFQKDGSNAEPRLLISEFLNVSKVGSVFL